MLGKVNSEIIDVHKREDSKVGLKFDNHINQVMVVLQWNYRLFCYLKMYRTEIRKKGKQQDFLF